MSPFTWKTESDAPAPTDLVPVDDQLSADEALTRVRRGEVLLHTGGFHNAKQLLAAMGRRLPPPPKTSTTKDAFRAERQSRLNEHRTLGNIVVKLDSKYVLQLAKAPDVALACSQVWGPATGDTVVALKTLLGMLGAAQWRKTGLVVPGLKGVLRPHYGVYVPTRPDYVELVRGLREVQDKRVFDLGTGTGVLSLLLLQRGVASVVATDCDERAVLCANENAAAFGFAKQFEAQLKEGYPDGTAQLVLCNPPWIPEKPRTRVDRGVFDDESAFLLSFLDGLRAHLEEGGLGVLLISNLAELFGLREEGWLQQQFDRLKLTVVSETRVKAKHGKAKDKTDRLFEARSKEVTSMYVLSPRA